MKFLIALFVVSLSLSAFAVDPVVDIHFAEEAIKGVDSFKLSETDQARLNWAIERLNFAINNLNSGYREGQGSTAEFANCVSTVSEGTHLSGKQASDFCERNSSQAAISCVIKLDETNMPTIQAAEACLRHAN